MTKRIASGKTVLLPHQKMLPKILRLLIDAHRGQNDCRCSAPELEYHLTRPVGDLLVSSPPSSDNSVKGLLKKPESSGAAPLTIAIARLLCCAK